MEDNNPFVKDIYSLELVPNICQQALREIFQNPVFSIAHVAMGITSSSLLHEHSKMEEIYYLTSGAGVMQVGSSESLVYKGDFIVVPPNQQHKLTTIGEQNIEHLVFALPPFNSEDIHLLDEATNHPAKKEFNRLQKKLFAARDGAKVYELDSVEDRQRRKIGFAAGFLEPKRKAIRHYHNISDELYFVVSGNGMIQLNQERTEVKKGSLIYVPRGTLHGLSNSEDRNLEVLCVSFPEYHDEDFLTDASNH